MKIKKKIPEKSENFLNFSLKFQQASASPHLMGMLIVDTDHEDSDESQHYRHEEDQGFNAAYESKEVRKCA